MERAMGFMKRDERKLARRIQDQLTNIATRQKLVCSFFQHPFVHYISDW
jgi:hypothetical protein